MTQDGEGTVTYTRIYYIENIMKPCLPEFVLIYKTTFLTIFDLTIIFRMFLKDNFEGRCHGFASGKEPALIFELIHTKHFMILSL
jgi:hypothetical protein